jgi:hypothetical protein
MIRKWWSFAFAIGLAAIPSLATTVVIVRTRNAVVIASDAKAQYQGAQGDPQVCKIAKQNETYFVVAGLAHDTGRGFLANRVISSAIARNDTFEGQVNSAESDMLEALAKELAQLRAEEPEAFKFAVTGESPSSIGLITVEDGVPKVAVLSFLYDRASGGVSVKRDSCPGSCGGDYSIIQMGRVLPKEEFDKVSGSPTKIAKTLVELEIARDPADVGPPIEILEIGTRETEWLQDDLNCAAQVNVRKKYPRAVTVQF